MNSETIENLATAAALGALDGPDQQQLRGLLAAHPELAHLLAECSEVTIAMARALPRPSSPRPELRGRVLAAIRSARQKDSSKPGPLDMPLDSKGHSVFRGDVEWAASVVPGVRYKVVSAGAHRDSTILLVQIAARTWFPEHTHPGNEDLYVLSGDLKCEDQLLKAGDCFHAEPGSHHHPLYSESGCTALLVLPKSAAQQLIGTPSRGE